MSASCVDPDWRTAYRALGHRFKKRRLWANLLKPLLNVRLPKAPSVTPKTLLLVRLDRVGDYVLFRNYLPDLRAAFADWQITLCGNRVYRDLAETLDGEWVDRFIWIDRNRFVKQRAYHLALLTKIYRSGFALAVQPAYSRDPFADLIVWASQAPERIGVDGDPAPQSPRQREISDAFYTRLLAVDVRPKFEFWRNREIVEHITGRSSLAEKPQLTLPQRVDVDLPTGDYAVLVPGAGSRHKVWRGFGAVAEELHRRYGLPIVVVGSGRQDREAVNSAFNRRQRHAVLNYCDRTTLVQLAALLQRATMVIANDTAAVHMAAALGRPTIGVSAGNNAFRFNEYPPEFGFNVRFLFPPRVERLRETKDFAHHFTEYSEIDDLQTITVERVCRAADEMLTHE